MTIPSDLCKLSFKTMSLKSVDVFTRKDVTTNELIQSIAEAMQVSPSKIVFSLDLSLKIKGHVATQENAEDVDAQVMEQFKCNIVSFMAKRGPNIVVVKL